MIEVNTSSKTVQYQNPDALIDNIEKDFGEGYEEIELQSLIIDGRDYKNIIGLPTLGEVWYWYYEHKKFAYEDEEEKMKSELIS